MSGPCPVAAAFFEQVKAEADGLVVVFDAAGLGGPGTAGGAAPVPRNGGMQSQMVP